MPLLDPFEEIVIGCSGDQLADAVSGVERWYISSALVLAYMPPQHAPQVKELQRWCGDLTIHKFTHGLF